jgi:hypothetical protein
MQSHLVHPISRQLSSNDSHRTCLLNVLARGPFCPKCLTQIPLATDPIPTITIEQAIAIIDELSLSEHDRHSYVAEVHKIYARRSLAEQLHDTLQLHHMAIRNHEEWARTAEQDHAEGIRRGLYIEAIKYRKEAVEAENRAMEAESHGDAERAWMMRQEAAVAGYKAAKAEDERY